MNYPILLAGAIVAIAFAAHALVGNREAMSTRPATPAEGMDGNTAAVERNWVQSFCAFQMVTVDLFALALLLFALGATELIPARREVALAASAFFSLWGIAWLGQLLFLRRRVRDYLLLSQWLFWFACSALLYWGAQEL